MLKPILPILTVLTFTFQITAQNVNIPDADFKGYLLGNSAINTNSDTEIQLSEAQSFAGTIDLSSILTVSLDLTGLDAFTSLTGLICIAKVGVNHLDLSSNSALTLLDCRTNGIVSLTLSQNAALTVLRCSQNNITSLDLSQNTQLTELDCSFNALTSLNVSQNPLLTNFNCSYNNLSSLNMKNLSTNILTTFDATVNSNLVCIEVDDVNAATIAWTNIDATASFGTSCLTGISNHVLNKDIRVYPNPVNSVIFIESEVLISSVEVWNLSGQRLIVKYEELQMIDISFLSKGIYMLHVLTEEGYAIKKLVKE